MQHLNLSDLPIRVKNLTKIRYPLPDYPDCVAYADVAIDNIATVYAVKLYKREGIYKAEFTGNPETVTFSIGGIPVSDRKLSAHILQAVADEYKEDFQ